MAQCWNFAIGVSVALYALFSPIWGRTTGAKQWDPNGYILYCPCSGQFSGQVEAFLGTVSFAKHLNRTLVVPPFINYPCGRKLGRQQGGTQLTAAAGRFSNQVELFLGSLLFAKTLERTLVVPPIIDYQHTIGAERDNLYAPFTKYFDLEPVGEYHDRIITLEEFLETHADMKWPKGSRKAYCSKDAADMNNGICPRGGNPFGQFWSDHGIEFDESEIWEDQLFFNVEYEDHAEKWKNTFPPEEHEVLVFMNAPTFNPIAEQAEQLHALLKWSPSVEKAGNEIIDKMKRPYIAIHLRNGADWTRTCDLTDKNYQRILSSYQCTGRVSGDTFVTRKMCIQSEEQVVEEVRKAVKKLKAKTIFIGTDHVSMQEDIQEEMERMKEMEEGWDLDVQVVHADPDEPQIDMYVMAKADYFIGNCVSAFSAFVKRERDVLGLETGFFGWPIEETNHDEL